jgi:hypothetical protein
LTSEDTDGEERLQIQNANCAYKFDQRYNRGSCKKDLEHLKGGYTGKLHGFSGATEAVEDLVRISLYNWKNN